ncbi:hypothetical protein PACIG1_6007 [Pseudomonas aeruginosa CIG1]|nr:hypothetical protein PACIG1_6007 [Pseudomonas aeruginosa CIG1]EKA54772.1 hypothetical protein PABE173_2594 [Pseudomonas aeruginosa ATCC 25324]
MGLTPTGGHRHASRWPGWGSLLAGGGHGHFRAGGHPGGICSFGQPPLPVALDRLAVDAGKPGYLPLGLSAFEQRQDRRALIGLQDIHSLAFPREDPVQCVLPTGADGAGSYLLSPINSGGGVWGGHQWGSLGGRRGYDSPNLGLQVTRLRPHCMDRHLTTCPVRQHGDQAPLPYIFGHQPCRHLHDAAAGQTRRQHCFTITELMARIDFLPTYALVRDAEQPSGSLPSPRTSDAVPMH